MRFALTCLFLGTTALYANAAEARTQRYCNYSTEKITIAVQHTWLGAPDPAFGSQTAYGDSFGWYRLDVGACTTVSFELLGYANSDRVNLYASGDRGTVWAVANGPRLCVSRDGSNFHYRGNENTGGPAPCQTSGGYLATGFSPGFADYTFSGGSNQSVLTVCNQRPDGLAFSVAIAYHKDNKWLSQGWWTVPTGCQNIALGAFSGELYFNAMFSNGNAYIVPNGPAFCVQGGGNFKLEFADSMACTAAMQKKLPMSKFQYTAGQVRTFLYK